jgi:hypothetical protein
VNDTIVVPDDPITLHGDLGVVMVAMPEVMQSVLNLIRQFIKCREVPIQ